MFRHITAGLFGMLFARWLERVTEDRPRRHRALALLAIGAIFLAALPLTTNAAEPLNDGATVRIRSGSIEAGWHTGRLKRDQRRCSVIELDRPTEHGYKSLALTVVDALQLGRIGDWTAIDARRAIASEPSHCRVDGSD